MPTQAQLKGLFNAFDTDGNNFISLSELEAALKKGNKKVSLEECEEILKQVDTNSDGQISFEEFEEVFKLAPDSLPPGVAQLVDVSGMLLHTLLGGAVGLGKLGVSGTMALAKGVSSGAVGLVGAVGGLLTPRSSGFDIKDTNVANIGSDEDKAARKSSAEAEAAWQGCGQAVGIEIWRVEKFKIVPWPKADHGKFYDGDSYIVLHTHKEKATDKLLYDIYFWLGVATSQDEMGTAAYKTVELDALFDDAAVQHREVMKFESSQFKSLFKAITYLKGGVASGFSHVEPGAYVAKLLHVKKIERTTCIVEVPCTRSSLNEGDAFVLDAGATIYVWSGSECSPFEKLAANLAAENIEGTRHGAARATINIDDGFWAKLGGEGAIKSKDEANEVMPTISPVGEGVLFKLSDASGKLHIAEVGRGDLTKSMLSSEDVFLCDPGPELIVWVGSKASERERRAAFNTASNYLRQQSKPLSTPVAVLKEGQDRHKLFAQIFAN